MFIKIITGTSPQETSLPSKRKKITDVRKRKVHPASFSKSDSLKNFSWYSIHMKRRRGGSTLKQYAYAVRRLSPGEAGSKQEIALLVGYSPSIAKNALNKIERTEGYKNAMVQLGLESNDLLLAVMHEFKARGLTNFSNKELNSALNAISVAWDRIEKRREPDKLKTPEGNPLRAAFIRRVETRIETQAAVVQAGPNQGSAPPAPPSPEQPPEPMHVDPIDMDF
jgi:hypothetical protein